MLVTVFQAKPTINIADITVVVGSATVLASNDAPQVIARAVPLSVIRIISISPSTGVPVRLVVIDVIAWARPVIEATSVLSVFMAGVADWVTVTTRRVVRLLVKVCEAVVPTTC